MRAIRRPALLAVALAVPLCAAVARAQTAPSGEAKEEPDAAAWSVSATGFTYFVPDEGDFLLPIVTVDHGSLHLEARYNYEERNTASLWAGWTFSGGKALEWEVTPIAGFLFGDLDGVAFGYEGTLRWRSLELYSESEVVIDTSGSDGDFFYNWSELTVSPLEWLRLGLVAQRTRVYDSGREVNVGPLAGFTIGKVDVAAYALNLDADATVILGVGFAF